MRGRWVVTSPFLILAAVALAGMARHATWMAAGLTLAGLALLAGNRLVRRRPGGEAAEDGVPPGAG